MNTKKAGHLQCTEDYRLVPNLVLHGNHRLKIPLQCAAQEESSRKRRPSVGSLLRLVTVGM